MASDLILPGVILPVGISPLVGLISVTPVQSILIVWVFVTVLLALMYGFYRFRGRPTGIDGTDVSGEVEASEDDDTPSDASNSENQEALDTQEEEQTQEEAEDDDVSDTAEIDVEEETPEPESPAESEEEVAASANQDPELEDDNLEHENLDEANESEASTNDSTGTPSSSLMLRGVNLPDELASQDSVTDGADHCVFYASSDDPEAIGTAFADALSDAGFDIEPDGFDRAIARRNQEVLTMKITPDGGSSKRYRTAKNGQLVIEVWTGTGFPPKLKRGK